jgi:hypothetical protein
MGRLSVLLGLLAALLGACAPLVPESFVDRRAAALPSEQRSRMSVSGERVFGWLLLGLIEDVVTPDEPVDAPNESWIAHVRPNQIDLAPGKHRFRTNYPSNCAFELMMEAGHAYQVIGSKHAPGDQRSQPTVRLIKDRSQDGHETVLELRCTPSSP